MDSPKDRNEPRSECPNDDSPGSGAAESESAETLAGDAARFLSALQAELRDARREFRSFAVARLARAQLSLKESLLGMIAGLVALGVLLTMAVVGTLALSRGVHGGLLVWTESPWLAEAMQGLFLLMIVTMTYPLLRWNMGRNAVRRVERSESEQARRAEPSSVDAGSTEGAN